jgi:hypothetical protein
VAVALVVHSQIQVVVNIGEKTRKFKFSIDLEGIGIRNIMQSFLV